MDSPAWDPRQDRPITSGAADCLDRGPFVESLVRALVHDPSPDPNATRQATGYVVGLTGRWGLGKSSILSLLSERLGSMDRVIVATFNPWLFRGRDELLSGFFAALKGSMGRKSALDTTKLEAALERYQGAIDLAGHGIAALVDAYGAAGVATVGWRKWGRKLRQGLPRARTKTPEDERSALELAIKSSRSAVVVLIDDLDRLEDEEVRAVAQLIKAVGDIRGVS